MDYVSAGLAPNDAVGIASQSLCSLAISMPKPLRFSEFSGARTHVTLHVVPSATPKVVENHYELRQLDKSLTGGSHYDATDIPGFRRDCIWICPVTLCVLGPNFFNYLENDFADSNRFMFILKIHNFEGPVIIFAGRRHIIYKNCVIKDEYD